MAILDQFNLSGKTALVTGCKRGIGKSMAVGLAEAGADVIGVSASLEAAGSDVEKDVTALGRSFRGYSCDFSDREKANFAKLQQYLDARKAGAADDAGKTATDFIAEILKKRLFSSPAAFLATLEKHEKTLRGIREQRARRRPTALLLKRQRARAEEDYADDEELEENLDELVDEWLRLYQSGLRESEIGQQLIEQVLREAGDAP